MDENILTTPSDWTGYYQKKSNPNWLVKLLMFYLVTTGPMLGFHPI